MCHHCDPGDIVNAEDVISIDQKAETKTTLDSVVGFSAAPAAAYETETDSTYL